MMRPPMTDADLPLRQAVRALMIDHQDRVLLVKIDLERKGWIPGWILPGGGIEADEDPHVALRRELIEETGLADPFIGPIVCQRLVHGLTIAAGYRGQQENIYLVPCHDFALAPALTEAELRSEGIVGMQWFTLPELRALDDKLFPADLPALIERVLEFGGSIDPLQIEETAVP